VPGSGERRGAADGTGRLTDQGGAGFDELLEPAVLGRAIRPPPEKSGRLPEPVAAVNSRHDLASRCRGCATSGERAGRLTSLYGESLWL
jgi:hypothetical protein